MKESKRNWEPVVNYFLPMLLLFFVMAYQYGQIVQLRKANKEIVEVLDTTTDILGEHQIQLNECRQNIGNR